MPPFLRIDMTKKAKKTLAVNDEKKTVKPTIDAVVMVSVKLPSGQMATYRYTIKNIKGNVIPSHLTTQLFNQVFTNALRAKFGDSIKAG